MQTRLRTQRNQCQALPTMPTLPITPPPPNAAKRCQCRHSHRHQLQEPHTTKSNVATAAATNIGTARATSATHATNVARAANATSAANNRSKFPRARPRPQYV